MLQRRQSLKFDNLADVLRSAKNAGKFGTQQFETPSDMASALMQPLTPYRGKICDLQCGHGSLTAAACNATTRYVCGIDIDPTATAIPRDLKVEHLTEKSVIHGDINHIAPLLREVGWKADLLVLNPPFSLKWPEGDSTLVTWNLAQEFLSRRGEGVMLCNDSTARRLIANTDTAKRIWLWVTVPNFFPGVDPGLKIAVLYFAGDHEPDTGDSWIEFQLPSNNVEAATEALSQFAHSRKRLIRGDTIERECYSNGRFWREWKVVAQEWRRRRSADIEERNGWNIRLLPDGRLDVWLTPFQQLSGNVPRQLAEELQSMDKKHPSALVVQKPSRLALQRAVAGGIWRVHPDVNPAVEKAVVEYHAIRAPFNKLNPTQRLAYLDEEDSILCLRNWQGFTAGKLYPMQTHTFEGKKIETRKRPGRTDEQILVSGIELAIAITDDNDEIHSFTQFQSSNDTDEARPPSDYTHTLSELVETFDIPEVPDVATVNPSLYITYKNRLLDLQGV